MKRRSQVRIPLPLLCGHVKKIKKSKNNYIDTVLLIKEKNDNKIMKCTEPYGDLISIID